MFSFAGKRKNTDLCTLQKKPVDRIFKNRRDGFPA